MKRRNIIKTFWASLFGGATAASAAVVCSKQTLQTDKAKSFNDLSLKAQEWILSDWPEIHNGVTQPFHIGFNTHGLTKEKLEAIQWLKAKGTSISIFSA